MANEKYLYLLRAGIYRESDPARGVVGGTEFSDFKVISAQSPGVAKQKLLDYLRKSTRYRNWEISNFKKLEAGKGIPLEERLKILGEVVGVIE